MPKKQKQKFAVVNVRVWVGAVRAHPEGYEGQISLAFPVSIKVQEALEACAEKLFTQSPHLVWCAPELEFGFTDDTAPYEHCVHPPLHGADPLIPILKEAKPFGLTLRVSEIYILTDRCIAEEEAWRANVVLSWDTELRCVLKRKEVDCEVAVAAEEKRVWFETKVAGLLQEYRNGREVLEKAAVQRCQEIRDAFSVELVAYMKHFVGNARRLSGIRERLLGDLRDAGTLFDSLPPTEQTEAFPLNKKQPPPGPRPEDEVPRSLWGATLPTKASLVILTYVEREIGPPYKRNAPDGLVHCSAPQEPRRARAALPKLSEGFLTGVDRAVFGMYFLDDEDWGFFM